MKSLLILLVAGAVYAADLPAGWTAVTSSDEKWRSKSPTKFLSVKGDFDGDGKADSAVIARSSEKNQFAIVALLSSQPEPVVIETFPELGRQGIADIKPGRYKTACGKGYGDWACANGEPDYLVLKAHAIDFFANESADVFFYWSPKQRKFVRIQISD